MNIVKDRHKAFASVIESDDLTELRKYCKKYGVVMPANEKVAIAGALKAIQQCTDFSEEEKTKAAAKCFNMGFNPFMRPYGED